MKSYSKSALISSDSEIIQFWLSAVHYPEISDQRWFSFKQRWKPKMSELKISADFLWNSSKNWNNQCEKINSAFLWNKADHHRSKLKQLLWVLIFSETALDISELRSYSKLFAFFRQEDLNITLSGKSYHVPSQQTLDLVHFCELLQETIDLTLSVNLYLFLLQSM